MIAAARPEDPSKEAYRKLSFWLDSLPDPLQPRPGLRGDWRTDVAIVGAGYTGLWTAWYLKQIDPALEVTLLESEIAGFGASGRNGGWCSAYLSGIDGWYADPRRRDGAIRLQRQMFETVGAIGRLTQEQGIDCHFEAAGALEIAVLPAQLQRLRDELKELRALGFNDDEYRWLDGADIRQTLAVDRALAAIHMPACAAIHPARLARGLAERLEQAGAVIFERSPVVAAGPGEVRTASGRLLADTVLLATEGYGAGLPEDRRLIPVHSMMVATEPLPRELLDELQLQRRFCFGNRDRIVTYGQRTADNRIAFGCRGEYRYGSGLIRRFDADEPVFQRVRETLLRFFPRLRGIRFTHAWGGALGVSRSRRPAVCFDPLRRTGWAGGYFGNGVAASHLAGQTLADLVLEQDTERVHTPWVNPPEARRNWEPEPLRWLGFRASRGLMTLGDRADYLGLPGGVSRVLDRLLP